MDQNECRQFQDDEKIAIQSIFENEAVFETNVWKVWKPIKVRISLKPIDSPSRVGPNASSSLFLVVSCSAEYPNIKPTYSFENVNGLSSEQIDRLKQSVNTKMDELIGMPMILEMCSVIRMFLYDHEKPILSFHETMVKHEERVLSNQRRERAYSEQREMEMLEEERDKKQLEMKWQREQELERSNTGFETVVIGAHKVHVLSRSCDLRPKPHKFCHEWIGLDQEKNKILITEYVFQHNFNKGRKLNKTFDLDAYSRLFDDLENQLCKYVEVVNSEHTLLSVSFTVVQRLRLSAENIFVKIFVGQRIGTKEALLGTVLSTSNEDALLRRLASNTVCGLRYLHDKDIAHGSLNVNCFWIEDGFIKLSDAVHSALIQSAFDVFANLTTNEGVLDNLLDITDKSVKRKDIFSLGTILDNFRKCSQDSNRISPESPLDRFVVQCQSVKVIEDLLSDPYLVSDVPTKSGSSSAVSGVGEIDARSRLAKEFFLLKWLGKGGFGDVLLARNRLDGNDYAVKRIPLDQNEKMNRRITKEAKLFAKLNHPNVVRYYNAWTEEKYFKRESNNSSPINEQLTMAGGDSILPSRLRNIVAPPVQSTVEASEWSTSYLPNDIESSSSDDDDDDVKPARTLFSPRSNGLDDSFEIFFEGTDDSSVPDHMTESLKSPQKSSKESSVPLNTNQMLYIQMEFCEHATLRNFIDNKGFVKSPSKIWKMFGEILHGLHYIHQQGMIHRDIKPMNILLDAHDQVKIGDFGLATHDLRLRKEVDITGVSVSISNGGQTRDIGTELYMAPELFDVSCALPYTSKIDIYSAGIVLFEMFYRPLPPGMERLSTIKGLKKDDMFIPKDFGEGFSEYQTSLARYFIERMLQKDARCRPNVEDLLMDNRLPLVDADDQSFQQTFTKTIKAKSGRLYEWIIDSLFKERPSSAVIRHYDDNICKERIDASSHLAIEEIREGLVTIFQMRSFEPLYLHLLAPSSEHNDNNSKVVKVLDAAGVVISLPLDLRRNFARYCSRNAIQRFKRFSFDRVFSTNDCYASHPNERWEGTLDCIGPKSACLSLTTELLSVVCHVAQEYFPTNQCVLRIGHVGFIEAAIHYLSVAKEYRSNVYNCLHQFFVSIKQLTLDNKVDILGQVIGKKEARSLLTLLCGHSSLNDLKTVVGTLLKHRASEAASLASSAMTELENLSHLLEIISREFPTEKFKIVYDGSIAYRPGCFRDGLVFGLSVEIPEKRNKNVLVMAGGRYDNLLVQEGPSNDPFSSSLCLIGCSIFVTIIAAAKKSSSNEQVQKNILICSFHKEFVDEKFELANLLWRRGIYTDIIQTPISSMDTLVEHCNFNNIDNVLAVFDKNEVFMRAMAVDYGKMSFSDAVERFIKVMEEEDEFSQRIEPRQTAVTTPKGPANLSNCNIIYASAERVNFLKRRKTERNIRTLTTETISLFASASKIEIIACDLSSDLIKTICSSIRRSSEVAEITNLFDGLAKHYGKSKQDLEAVFECLKQVFKSSRSGQVPIIILFGDDFYRVIL